MRVDQDSRPDLSNRYEDYGWPATVVFNADGHEIVKRQGYLPPEEMASMLQAIIDDPTPGAIGAAGGETGIAAASSLLTDGDARADLKKNYLDAATISSTAAGAAIQKFLDWDSVEYCMDLARLDGRCARGTHGAADSHRAAPFASIPAWGGVYQYSTGGDWNSSALREDHADAGGKPADLFAGVRAMARSGLSEGRAGDPPLPANFLRRPEGAFYTSQDADLVEGEHSADYFALTMRSGANWAFHASINIFMRAKMAGPLTL